MFAILAFVHERLVVEPVLKLAAKYEVLYPDKQYVQAFVDERVVY